MQIVMLGHSNAGKTTYMSMMYRAMATHGLQGFWLRAQDDGDHRRLLTMAAGVEQGNYPPPSERRGEYALTLRHGASSLIDFTWKDYRGGALRDRSTESQTSELLADLTAADAILLFLDSADLEAGSAIGRTRVRDLTTAVFRALDGRERSTPIAVLLTKADLVDPGRVEERIEPLRGFVAAIGGQRAVYGTLLEVICGPDSQNIVAPVLFSLYFGLTARANELYYNVMQAQAAATEFRRRDTIVDRVISRVKNERTYRELAGVAEMTAYHEYVALQPLIEPAEALKNLLSGMRVF